MRNFFLILFFVCLLASSGRIYDYVDLQIQNSKVEQKHADEEKAWDARARLEGHTIPSREIAKSYNYCKAVIAAAARKGGADEKEIYAFAFKNENPCGIQLLAEKGDAFAKAKLATMTTEDKASAQNYVAAARQLGKAAERGDVAALVLLRVATPQTNHEEYMKELYRSKNITVPPVGTFPVKLFDNDEVPLPAGGARGVMWLDNNTIIYKANDNEHLVDFLSLETPHQPQPLNEPIIAVNLTDLSIKKNYSATDLEAAQPKDLHGKPFPDSSLRDCVQLLPGDGHVCYMPPPAEKNENTSKMNHPASIHDTFDPKTIIVVKDTGDEKKILFDRPVYPIREFRYDHLSDTYWISSNEKVWRFDRQFNTVSEETYPKGLWGNDICTQTHWHPSWGLPCHFLEFPVKPGFLVGRFDDIRDRDNDRKRLFDAGGLFLVTKEGQAFKVYDDLNRNSDLSISPDGCKGLFVKFSEREKEIPSGAAVSQYYGVKAKVGIIDVCQYSSNDKKP